MDTSHPEAHHAFGRSAILPAAVSYSHSPAHSFRIGVPMRYVVAIFAFTCAIAWDFTQNHGAFTQGTVRSVSHFVRTTL